MTNSNIEKCKESARKLYQFYSKNSFNKVNGFGVKIDNSNNPYICIYVNNKAVVSMLVPVGTPYVYEGYNVEVIVTNKK